MKNYDNRPTVLLKLSTIKVNTELLRHRILVWDHSRWKTETV